MNAGAANHLTQLRFNALSRFFSIFFLIVHIFRCLSLFQITIVFLLPKYCWFLSLDDDDKKLPQPTHIFGWAISSIFGCIFSVWQTIAQQFIRHRNEYYGNVNGISYFIHLLYGAKQKLIGWYYNSFSFVIPRSRGHRHKEKELDR